MTHPDFNQYISSLIAEGKRQLVIRGTNQLAWSSGIAEYLQSKFECRLISFDADSADFVAYILKPKTVESSREAGILKMELNLI